jgi:hypothetical protein
MGKKLFIKINNSNFILSDIRQNFLKILDILRQKVLQYRYSQANTSSGVVRVAPASGQNIL